MASILSCFSNILSPFFGLFALLKSLAFLSLIFLKWCAAYDDLFALEANLQIVLRLRMFVSVLTGIVDSVFSESGSDKRHHNGFLSEIPAPLVFFLLRSIFTSSQSLGVSRNFH